MTDQYDIINHDSNGRGSTKAIECVAQQAKIALKEHHNLTSNLMKEIASIANLQRAFKSVKRNDYVDRMKSAFKEDTSIHPYFRSTLADYKASFKTRKIF